MCWGGSNDVKHCFYRRVTGQKNTEMNSLHLTRCKMYLKLVLPLLGSCIAVLVATGASRKKEKESIAGGNTIVANVMSMGAVGNGIADDTKAFQKTIDYVAAKGGGTVLVPKGNYLIDGDTSVRIQSYVTLKMDTAARLIAKPTASKRSYILLVLNATDVTIIDGKIMGDRNEHLDTTGEWGMGIAVYAGTNITINGTKIYNCWGDGIVIGSKGGAPFNASNPSRNVTVKNVVSDNNRRQALTIGKVNGVWVDSCIFTNTSGTKPMCGIDIEPDRDTAQNITITNCELAYNKGNGVEMYENSKSVIQNVVVQNNFIHHNAYGGYVIRPENVQFNHNRIIQNKYGPPIKAVDTLNCILSPNTYR
jgi:polygalacturonase